MHQELCTLHCKLVQLKFPIHLNPATHHVLALADPEMLCRQDANVMS